MTPEDIPISPPAAPRKRHGDRRRSAPQEPRVCSIFVRLSAVEHAQLRARAESLHLPCAQFVREAALSRRFKPPPVAAVNRDQYIELSRLAENLHELTALAHEGHQVTVADALIRRLSREVARLRLELIGAVPVADWAERKAETAATSSSSSSP
jgi:hypothetical protein